MHAGVVCLELLHECLLTGVSIAKDENVDIAEIVYFLIELNGRCIIHGANVCGHLVPRVVALSWEGRSGGVGTSSKTAAITFVGRQMLLAERLHRV